MKVESLYRFSSEDWKKLENQYADGFGPTFKLVTENNGSLAESQEVYLESFVYYTQLLELHGFNLVDQSDAILYSFSRKLWIQKLRKRRVDVNFVKHHHHFLDMEDAFHEIDSIREKSEKTASKLAEIGEPSRTLLLEYLGRRKELLEAGSRLGYSDADRALTQVVKGIKRLVELVDAKTIEINDALLGKMILEIVNTKDTNHTSGYSEAEQIDQTIVARAVALLRSYVIRNERMQQLKELQVRVIPSVEAIHEKKSKNTPLTKSKTKTFQMKPYLMAAASVCAIVIISGLTALGVVGVSTTRADDVVVFEDTTATEVVAPLITYAEVKATAFQINQGGLIITAAQAVAGETEVELKDQSQNRSLKAKVCFVDRALNVALLQVEGTALEPIPYRFAPEDAKIGQTVFTLAQHTDEVIYEQAYIAASTKNQMGRIKADVSLAGAPIWSEQGQLIGMVSSAPEGGQGDKLSAIVHGSLLKDVLDRWSKQSGNSLDLTNRNKLFFSDRTQQLEQIKPHLFEISYQQEIPATIP